MLILISFLNLSIIHILFMSQVIFHLFNYFYVFQNFNLLK